MADREIAQRVLLGIQQLKRRVRPVTSEDGLVATPQFPPSTLGTVEHLLDATSLSPAEIAARLATPLMWTCARQKAPTAAEAIELAKRARTKLRSAGAAAAAHAKTMGLPPLTGSPKQQDWATQIRFRHALTHPDSPYLRTERAATWWINNQRCLEAPT